MRQETMMRLCQAHFSGNRQYFRNLVEVQARTTKSTAERERLERLLKRFPEVKQLAPLPPGLAAHIDQPTEAPPLLLEEPLQQQLDEVVDEHEAREQLERHGLAPTRRILLHGPTGNGKTGAADWLCRELELTPMSLSLAGVIQQFMGATGAALKGIFEGCTELHGLIIDELDAIGARRAESEGTSGEANRIVNTLLTLLDRTSTGAVVATTNRLEHLDEALVRRFDRVIEFPAPSSDSRAALAAELCERFGISFTPELEEDARDEPSFSHVERLVRQAARHQILRRSPILSAVEPDRKAS